MLHCAHGPMQWMVEQNHQHSVGSFQNDNKWKRKVSYNNTTSSIPIAESSFGITASQHQGVIYHVLLFNGRVLGGCGGTECSRSSVDNDSRDP